MSQYGYAWCVKCGKNSNFSAYFCCHSERYLRCLQGIFTFPLKQKSNGKALLPLLLPLTLLGVSIETSFLASLHDCHIFDWKRIFIFTPFIRDISQTFHFYMTCIINVCTCKCFYYSSKLHLLSSFLVFETLYVKATSNRFYRKLKKKKLAAKLAQNIWFLFYVKTWPKRTKSHKRSEDYIIL